MSDIFDDDEVKEWLDRARREMFPKMKESALSLIIYDSEPDAKLALEVGAAILHNKPLLVLAIKGRKIPPILRKIAAEVVEVDDCTTPASQAKIERALQMILRRPA